MAEGDAGARATAQAFRKMQLEGSVFAVAVIQLKPQLERLLNLPDDSLTKEVRGQQPGAGGASSHRLR